MGSGRYSNASGSRYSQSNNSRYNRDRSRQEPPILDGSWYNGKPDAPLATSQPATISETVHKNSLLNYFSQNPTQEVDIDAALDDEPEIPVNHSEPVGGQPQSQWMADVSPYLEQDRDTSFGSGGFPMGLDQSD